MLAKLKPEIYLFWVLQTKERVILLLWELGTKKDDFKTLSKIKKKIFFQENHFKDGFSDVTEEK
jgi:hypothetical protein